MKVFKVISESVENTKNLFVFISVIDKEKRFHPIESMGYFLSDGRKHPVIIDENGTVWFDQTDDLYTETSNLVGITIKKDQYFCFNTGTQDESIYRIKSISIMPPQ